MESSDSSGQSSKKIGDFVEEIVCKARKPGFSHINLVFLQINLIYLKKLDFSGGKPGLSEKLGFSQIYVVFSR